MLGQVRVRASAAQAERLLAWAAAWPERTWAVEGADGLGHLLAQELVAAGERVLDVQPKLAARVRLLAAGAVNKNDPNDARSVAIVALRSAGCLPVRPDDHAAVLKIWSKRHRDLSRSRNQVACRLHAVLCELVPGGVAKEISADQAEPRPGRGRAVRRRACRPAASWPPSSWPTCAASTPSCARRRRSWRSRSGPPAPRLTEVFGVGPVIAATVIGEVARRVPVPRAGTVSRPITAPRRSRCRPATGSSTGCRGAGTGA